MYCMRLRITNRLIPGIFFFCIILSMMFTPLLFAGRRDIILATTTSTQDSGLLDELVPVFEKKSGYIIKTIAMGSGQAMAMGRRGEADVLLVHSPEAEKVFVKEGFGINRRRVMHNDFIIVGHADDSANIRGETSLSTAFNKIVSTHALFISRGDRSGTHSKEMEIWKRANTIPEGERWYIETGLGMGHTLRVASEKGGYTITDRGTYLALKKHLFLDIMIEGDPLLLNVYHVIEVNPSKWPEVNRKGAMAFANFLVLKDAQEIIRSFGVKRFGSPLFFPDAGKE